MSSVALSFTAGIIGVRDDTFIPRCQSARKHSILSAGSDAEVIRPYLHATADVLSQNLPMCLNLKYSTAY